MKYLFHQIPSKILFLHKNYKASELRDRARPLLSLPLCIRESPPSQTQTLEKGVKYVKVKNRKTRQRQWLRSGVFIVNFEDIWHLFLVLLLLTLKRQIFLLRTEITQSISIIAASVCFSSKKSMMMMMMMNCFCGIVDRRKAFSLISSWDHCQRSSSSQISDTPRAGFEYAEPESRLFWLKLCNNDNHYTTVSTIQSLKFTL